MKARELIIKKRNEIPARTRTAARWLLITGAVFEIVCLVLICFLIHGRITSHSVLFGDEAFPILLFLAVFACADIFVFYLLPGILALKGGRRGWILASALLAIPVFILSCNLFLTNNFHFFSNFSSLAFFFVGIVLLMLFLVPLVLLLKDHSSYKKAS